MLTQIDITYLIDVAYKAGQAIMTFYKQEHHVHYKEDLSPLTIADKSSNEIIGNALIAAYPEIPLVSEEVTLPSYEDRKIWEYFWLIDPLDGTKEFIKHRGDFTVNIALIEKNHPLLGIVYAPARDRLYYAIEGKGAWKMTNKKPPVKISTSLPAEGLVVVASLSHLSDRDKAFMDSLHVRERISFGSSLKFCAVAEGLAHVYPRFSPTWEWDTGAGHCILKEAGGLVVDKEGLPLRYNKPIMKHDQFIAVSHPDLISTYKIDKFFVERRDDREG